MQFYSDSDFVPDVALGYLTKRVAQLQSAMLEPVFANEGVTHTQWSALVSIYFGRGISCAALARDLAHDKGAMTRVIDSMEEKGWVDRRRDGDDRRVFTLELTPEGEAVTLRCRSRVIACWNDWLADWKHEEATELVRLLQRLRGTLEAAAADGGRA